MQRSQNVPADVLQTSTANVHLQRYTNVLWTCQDGRTLIQPNCNVRWTFAPSCVRTTSKTKRREKTNIGVNFAQCMINCRANSQFKRSKADGRTICRHRADIFFSSSIVTALQVCPTPQPCHCTGIATSRDLVAGDDDDDVQPAVVCSFLRLRTVPYFLTFDADVWTELDLSQNLLDTIPAEAFHGVRVRRLRSVAITRSTIVMRNVK